MELTLILCVGACAEAFFGFSDDSRVNAITDRGQQLCSILLVNAIDGVNDEEDKCPSTPGKPANNGCPEIKQDVVKKVAIAAKAIYYMSGKDVIQKVSYPKLDVVVKVLKADIALVIKIEGHTDNKGNAASNLILSAKRALAVKNYLVKEGIVATRITAEGFGDAWDDAAKDFLRSIVGDRPSPQGAAAAPGQSTQTPAGSSG